MPATIDYAQIAQAQQDDDLRLDQLSPSCRTVLITYSEKLVICDISQSFPHPIKPPSLRRLVYDGIQSIQWDELKTVILAHSAMSRNEKIAAIQIFDPGDKKPTDILMAINKYGRDRFNEELMLEIFPTKLPSDVRRLLRMQPKSTSAMELAQTVDL